MSGQQQVEHQVARAAIINAATALESQLPRLPKNVSDLVKTNLVVALDQGTSLHDAVIQVLLVPSDAQQAAQIPPFSDEPSLQVIEQAKSLDSALASLNPLVGSDVRRSLAAALAESDSLLRAVSAALPAPPYAVKTTAPEVPDELLAIGVTFPPRPYRGCGGGGRFD